MSGSVTPEEEWYLRSVYLLNIASKAVREYFDSIHSPSDLERKLIDQKSELEKEKIHPFQWKQIYPKAEYEAKLKLILKETDLSSLVKKSSRHYRNFSEEFKTALMELFESVPGEQEIEVKDIQKLEEDGSILVTFRLTSQYNSNGDTIKEVLRKAVDIGNIDMTLETKPDKFLFKEEHEDKYKIEVHLTKNMDKDMAERRMKGIIKIECRDVKGEKNVENFEKICTSDDESVIKFDLVCKGYPIGKKPKKLRQAIENGLKKAVIGLNFGTTPEEFSFCNCSKDLDSSVPSSKKFDTALLISLLRNLKPRVSAPSKGFDSLPEEGDSSKGAQLARIKYYRNEAAHSSTGSLSETEYKNLWRDVEQAMIDLGGIAYREEVEKAKSIHLDSTLVQILRKLVELESGNEKMCDYFIKLEKKMETLHHENKSHIQKTLDEIEELKKKITELHDKWQKQLVERSQLQCTLLDFKSKQEEQEIRLRTHGKKIEELTKKGSTFTKEEREQIEVKVDRHNVRPVDITEIPCNIEKWHVIEDEDFIPTANWKRLQDYMKSKTCVVLKGIIGSGKTALGMKYCYMFHQENPLNFVWKFPCTDLSMFNIKMRELFGMLPSSRVIRDENIDDKIQEYILQDLNAHGIASSCLLIFDDVKQSSKHIVEQFVVKCRKSSKIKTIITTSLSFEKNYFTDIVDMHGFDDDQAVSFLSSAFKETEEQERADYLDLAKKFSNNPKGLSIARTYMTVAKTSPKELVQNLDCPLDFNKWEETQIMKDHFYDRTLLKSLNMIICNMHKLYRESRKEEVFEMLLILQFLEVEKIPVTLFAKLSLDPKFYTDIKRDIKFYTDELVNAIENSSFGNVEGRDWNRVLDTHDIVVTALTIYSTLTESVKREELLERTLRSLFIMMDKDFQSEESKTHHKLLLPHAKAVVGHVDKLLADNSKSVDVDIILQCIYIKDIIGYIYSFNEMRSDADDYFESAMKMFCCHLEIDFHQEMNELNPSQLDELEDQVSKALKRILAMKSVMDSLKQLAKHYVLHKNRNQRDINVLQKALEIKNLERNHQLTEAQYQQLCNKHYAISDDVLGEQFLYELVISFLHTYGRRLFYLQQKDDNRWRTYYKYLETANKLCKKFNMDKSLHTVLTERSCMRAFLEFQLDDDLIECQDPIVKLKQYIRKCEERLPMQRPYLEFCLLKFLPGEPDIKIIWMKLIVKSCTQLVKRDKEEFSTYCRWAKLLAEEMIERKAMDYYPSLVNAVAEFYFVSKEMKTAETYYKQLLPKSFIEQSQEQIRFGWYQRHACIKYILCCIEGITDKESVDTLLEYIEKFRKYLEGYEEKEQLNELKDDLIKKINSF